MNRKDGSIMVTRESREMTPGEKRESKLYDCNEDLAVARNHLVNEWD